MGMVGNREQESAMLADLGPENVPRHLGGTSDLPTNHLPDHLRMPIGGLSAVIDAWRPQEIAIKARSRHEELRRLPAGSRIRWQWTLADHSIRFEVACRPELCDEFEIVTANEELKFDDLEDPVLGEALAPES